jgi:plastocyanin domain-containing protein
MSALLVNASGILLMAAIVWWFWLSPSPSITQSAENDHSHH